MLFKGAAYGDEKAFMVIQVNPGQSQSLTTGYPVQLAMAAASFNGTQATTAIGGTTLTQGFIGIAYKDIPANAYGTIQNLGPVASVLLSNAGTSITINLGDPLIPAPAGFYSGNPTYLVSGLKYVIASNVPVAVSAVAYCSGYIRAI